MKIAILGAGAWGTALALAFSRQHAVNLWCREANQCAAMQGSRENRRYLPGHVLPPAVTLSSDLSSALLAADLAVIATPLAGLRSTARTIAGNSPELPLLWVCKGLEAGTGKLPHQVVADETSASACGALTGPSFAEEVAAGLPTAVAIASHDGAFARGMADALHDSRLPIYANDDVIGAEVGGAVKNVLAIATGVCDGLGLGLNARAALITRGLAEITRFGVALGARRDTFMGLTGVGDLILTCTGDLSRNRRVGLALAAGQSLAAITKELGHVAEGVMTATEVAGRAAKLGIDMPITKAVYALIEGDLTPRDAVESLMGRDTKDE
jgi:glycerol-3-phosphate dehydrogenase (NAD(P)+)